MKIFCIGRNYVAHAKELNNKVPKQPLVFMKPATALTYNSEIPYPPFTEALNYELELCLLVQKEGKNIPKNEALSYISDIGLGIDYTARDIQSRCKEKGHSWEIAKAFDNSAAMSTFFPKENYDLSSIKFQLKHNGEVVQLGDTANMIFPVEQLIHHISQYFTIEAGDIIMTGTPAGVGPVQLGDTLEGYLEKELILTNRIKSN